MSSSADPLFAAAQARLATLPWAALPSLVAALEAPLHRTLAGTPTERVVDRFLRDHRALPADARAIAAEALFGVSLWRRRLRAQLPPSLHDPLHLLAALARDAGHPLLTPTLPPPPTLTDWRDRTSVPDWLADELLAAVGPTDAPTLAAACNLPGPVFLRVNTLRTSPQALQAALAARGVSAQPTAHATAGLRVTSARPNLYGLGLLGHFEVQDEGSQLLAELVHAPPGSEVLDRCAGAGGKTLALACQVGPTGLVHATDLDPSRLARLRTRAAHALAPVRVHGAAPPPDLRVARTLVDAPCSELGTLRRGPDLRWRLDPRTFSHLPATQLELLLGALDGTTTRVVYATCTLRRAENEAVVREALARRPAWALVPAGLPGLTSPEGFLVTRPDLHDTDGFFAAVLEPRPG